MSDSGEGEQRFRVIFDNVNDGILVIAVDTYEFIDANPRACEMFGYTHAEMLTLDSAKLSADDRPLNMAKREKFRDRAKMGEPIVVEWRCRAKDGLLFWAEIGVRLAKFDDRPVFLLTAHDVSERKKAQDAVAYYDRVMHAVTTSVSELVASADFAAAMAHALPLVGESLNVDRILVLEGSATNESMAGLTDFAWQRPNTFVPLHGQMPSAAEAREISLWLAPLLEGRPVLAYAAAETGFIGKVMRDMRALSLLMLPIEVGGTFWGRLAVENCTSPRAWSPIEIDAVGIFARVMGSVMGRKHAETQIEQMATHDALTGLPNRRLFIEALNLNIGRAKRAGAPFAVLYLDLDRFKDVNDILGHTMGDRLLQAVAQRLRANVRAIDTVARFGGDEFAAIAIEIHEPDDAAAVAEKILTALRVPFPLDGKDVRTGASVGIAVYGPDSPDAESLLSHADVALYKAKDDHRGSYRFYTEAMDVEVHARVRQEAELAEALASHQLFVVYQPQIVVATGAFAGLEALVRWQHPARGVLLPGTFIGAAERSGLIVELGHFVLSETCRQMSVWREAGIAPPLVSVNVSAMQFKTPFELEGAIAKLLAKHVVPPGMLELELTESVLMEASLERNSTLVTLRAMGLRIAIDDFGNGYSSFDYLRRFHVDRMKIPDNFIRDLCTEPINASIVRATLGLAHELNIEVVAEGVETIEQVELLESFGCKIIQGFYYAKPLDAIEVTRLLRVGSITPVLA